MQSKSKALFSVLAIGFCSSFLHGCAENVQKPGVRDCYRSETMKIFFSKKKVLVEKNLTADFLIKKGKVGWVISTPINLQQRNDESYFFTRSTIGNYDWNIINYEDDILIKIVSDKGREVYFSKCT